MISDPKTSGMPNARVNTVAKSSVNNIPEVTCLFIPLSAPSYNYTIQTYNPSETMPTESAQQTVSPVTHFS